MTASTEQDRAEFEAWRIGELRKEIGRPVNLQSDDDLRRYFLRINKSGQYYGYPEQQRFEAWQAARRAQVVQNRPTVDQVSDAIGYHSSGWDCANPDELIDAVLRLAAAPQSPDVAPVQLPEPVAYLHECGKKPSLRTLEFSKVAIQLSAKGYKSLPLYTEQQVRQLLAAQLAGLIRKEDDLLHAAIVSRPTEFGGIGFDEKEQPK